MTEKEALLLFNLSSGIGPARAKVLINYFGSARKVWEANDKDLLKTGLSEKLVLVMRRTAEKVDPSLRIAMISKMGIEVITWADKSYPQRLKDISDPPVVLYVKGWVHGEKTLGEICERSIAVVGTRRMTSYGVSVTESLVSDLVATGFTIISGLARGMDSLAHKTAVLAGGLTVGVLGCGVDKMYPPENKGLADRIASGSGFVISEFPCGMEAVPGNFPARNRVISGASMGVLITEAAEISGSLITASCAAEQGKPVFVVPGPITSSTSKGTNGLIKKGAIPVTGVDDILNEFGFKARSSFVKDVIGGNPLEEKILSVLRLEEVTLDELSKMLGMKVDALSSALTIMELSGKVRSYGGKWQIKGQR